MVFCKHALIVVERPSIVLNIYRSYGTQGVWQGPFTLPAEWRKLKKQVSADAAASAPVKQSNAASTPKIVQLPPNPACSIKGNINTKGEKIYHMPGGRYYDSTQIDESTGEKWFCSVAEAQSSGWRASSS